MPPPAPPPDAAPPPDMAPPVAAECVDNALKQPIGFDVTRGQPGGDLTFDSSGFMVSLDGRDIVRMARGARPDLLVNNAVPPFNRSVDGLGVLADGTVVITDTNGNSLMFSNNMRNTRREIDLSGPGKFLVGPNGNLLVAGAQGGEIYSVEPGNARVTVLARVDARFRGLTYSLDYKTIYLSDSKNGALHSAKLRADGTVEPPQVWVRGLGVFPDGVTTDICGNVYVSDRNGGPLLRVTPAGKLETVTTLNRNEVSGLAFGSGKQGWDDHTLYGVSERQGQIYEIRLGVRGLPPPPPVSQ
jgi:sugar lactone lactonase YvrE